MILYEEQKRFNQLTGLPVSSILIESGIVVCDYCASIIGDDLLADTKISITPLGNAEAWFHEDRDCLGDKYSRFDLYEFFKKQPSFHFCTRYNFDNCEKLLMMEWFSYYEGRSTEFELIVQELGPLYIQPMRPDNEICGVFSQSRYRVLRKILGSVKPEQLGIEFEIK